MYCYVGTQFMRFFFNHKCIFYLKFLSKVIRVQYFIFVRMCICIIIVYFFSSIYHYLKSKFNLNRVGKLFFDHYNIQYVHCVFFPSNLLKGTNVFLVTQ